MLNIVFVIKNYEVLYHLQLDILQYLKHCHHICLLLTVYFLLFFIGNYSCQLSTVNVTTYEQ